MQSATRKLAKRLYTTSHSSRHLSSKAIIGLTLAGIGAVVSGVVAFSGSYPQMKEIKHDAIGMLPHMIENSMITESISADVFINRPEFEFKVLRALTSEPTGSYWVIYGQKGAGKSELVNHMAMNRKGVVRLMVSSANSREDIINSLSKELLGHGSVGLSTQSLVSAMKACSITPIIILDVERDGPFYLSRGMSAVRSLAKALSGTCICLIVLNEARDILEFGKDLDRESYIYVDELTVEEARLFLKTMGLYLGVEEQRKCKAKMEKVVFEHPKVTLSEEELTYVFQNIGTSPARLKKLVQSRRDGETVEEFVQFILAMARQDFVKFPHKRILQALKEHPEGVSPEYFSNEWSDGVDLSNPQAVGAATEGSNIMGYRVELGVYQLLTTAHRTALATYTPIVTKDSIHWHPLL